MAEIRALSIRQPWAWAILHAGKDVENRSRGTGYRGLVAIHASLRAEADVLFPTPHAIRKYLTAQRDKAPELEVRGAVVAVARITDCHPGPVWNFSHTRGTTRPLCSPWAVIDQHHWLLSGVRPLAEPVPCKGALGLWRLPPDAEAAVRSQLPDLETS